MKKLFLAAVVFSVVLAGCVSNSLEKITAPDGSVLHCEVAGTPQEREIGLMNRSALCVDCCMLFVFEESGKHSFWMKGTLIPLDIVFLDENFSVVDVKENFLPCRQKPCESYATKASAKYAVEVNAGQAKKRRIAEGTEILHGK